MVDFNEYLEIRGITGIANEAGDDVGHVCGVIKTPDIIDGDIGDVVVCGDIVCGDVACNIWFGGSLRGTFGSGDAPKGGTTLIVTVFVSVIVSADFVPLIPLE